MTFANDYGFSFLLSLWDYPIPAFNIDPIISSFVKEELNDQSALRIAICLVLGNTQTHVAKFRELINGLGFENLWKHIMGHLGGSINKELF